MRSKTDSHENPIIDAPETLPPHLRDDSPRGEVRCWTEIEAENVRLREALEFIAGYCADEVRRIPIGAGTEAVGHIRQRALKALEPK